MSTHCINATLTYTHTHIHTGTYAHTHIINYYYIMHPQTLDCSLTLRGPGWLKAWSLPPGGPCRDDSIKCGGGGPLFCPGGP